MKELIIQALNEAFVVLEKQVPQTKRETKSVSIGDTKPIDLPRFMKDNNIPDRADFGGEDNGYDAWYTFSTCLSWEVSVPTTNEDKVKFRRKIFSAICFTNVYKILTKNGYKRVGSDWRLLKQFDDTTIYDMYINKDFDRLVKYYSMSFVKEQ